MHSGQLPPKIYIYAKLYRLIGNFVDGERKYIKVMRKLKKRAKGCIAQAETVAEADADAHPREHVAS